MSRLAHHSEFQSGFPRNGSDSMGQRQAKAWIERIFSSIAQHGRRFAPIPAMTIEPLERAKMLATSLLSARGEASGAAVSQELLNVAEVLTADERHLFLNFLAEGFQADPDLLAETARAYLAAPSAASAARVAEASEPPRQELLRRMNMADGGTRALIAFRKEIPQLIRRFPALALLDSDLRHLLGSWFNRGFLELRQIDWQTPAAILEKLIAYEAVHEIQGWDDLRRRLAPDRRCYAFFHPALPGEPLIFVEVALVVGLASSVTSLLERDTDETTQRQRASEADTAIFYSISNCQDGLRGISFGNFLIKQVVEILRMELPGLKTFATLSPAPGFRRWLDTQRNNQALPDIALSMEELASLSEWTGNRAEGSDGAVAVREALAALAACETRKIPHAVEPVLLKLCACYLTRTSSDRSRKIDPVARFHLGNGARLQRINWMGNPGETGLRESWGIMVNYLYDPAKIEANHERFLRAGEVARSKEVDLLLARSASRKGMWTRIGRPKGDSQKLL